MPVKPEVKDLNANSVQIMNTIRDEIGGTYADMVPEAANTTESIKEIGNIIMTFQPLQNAFLSALVNRIGRVIITSKLYSNPWAFLKQGLLEFGETVEEIFVNLAKPHQFDPAVAETEIFKREIPDVKAAFHYMNYQKFYKTTIANDQLRQAFLSWNGITDLIAKIVDSLYTGANYDEFLTMKYLIAKMALQGNIYSVDVPALTADNAKQVVSTIKGISNTLPFMSNKYNMAGVQTYTNKDEQHIFLNAKFESQIDVEVLASAFNMDKAEFFGRRVLVDSFGSLDQERLAILFANDPTYEPFTKGELEMLDEIPAIIVDRNWFMIFDNFYNFTEQYNGEGLYWNYWYHVWKTFSASPFNNAILFSNSAQAITSVTVNPTAVTVTKGSSFQFTASVSGTGFVNKKVTWTVVGGADAATAIDPTTGLLTVSENETATSLTVTATSVFDNTKTGTSTVTVAAQA